MPDFGGSTVQIFDAYVNYRYRPELQLQAGKFKSPVGLEAIAGGRDTLVQRTFAGDGSGAEPRYGRGIAWRLVWRRGELRRRHFQRRAGLHTARRSTRIMTTTRRLTDGCSSSRGRIRRGGVAGIWALASAGSYESRPRNRHCLHGLDAGLHHGRPAEILHLHQRRGGQWRSIGGFRRRAIITTGRSGCWANMSFPTRRSATAQRLGGFAEHGLGNFRRLGVDGRKCLATTA